MMPDGLRASEAVICEVTGVSQSLRQNWVTKHGLRRQPRGHYVDDDVRELAALKALLESLGPSDGSIAWKLVQSDLGAVWHSRPLVLLFDVQDKEATLAVDLDTLVSHLPYGRRVLATRLDEPITRASVAFHRVATT